MLILVVGPSGAGKDTLLDAIRAELRDDPNFSFARREITRPVTPGGEDHLPINAAQFETRRKAGAYALWWEAHGLCYGIPAGITSLLAQGITVIASVSRAVIAEAAQRFTIRVVEITAPAEILAKRLTTRNREDADDINRRLSRQMQLPDGIEIRTVMNDSTIAVGAQRLLAALRPA